MSNWTIDRSEDLEWCRPISSLTQKQLVARKLAERLRDGDVVGAGSGSTSYLTLLSLSERAQRESLYFSIIPTSVEIERICIARQIHLRTTNACKPDWSFDGADEVTSTGRLLKGRGGAMLREKLVMASSKERYIVVDESKFVQKLGQNFPVPIEVFPDAVELVQEYLQGLGMKTFVLRKAQAKDGPVITERGGLILDVRFEDTVPPEKDLEAIPGVLATGVFDNWSCKIVRVGT